MPLLICNGKAIFFAHVPKTGGSSVEDYLFRRFGPLSIHEPAKADTVRQRDVVVAATHLSASDLRRLLPPWLDYSFAFVRDPVARIISEYRFQVGASQASRLGFSTWLRVMLAAAARDPRIYENHIRPQADLVPADAEVFRLEDGFASIVSRLDAVTGTTAPEVEMRHLLKRDKAPLVLRRQDVARIVDYYRIDYDRFGYPLPDPGTYPADALGSGRDLVGTVLAPLVVGRHHRRWLR